MRKTFCLLCLATLLSGCGYLHDRGRDACDVVTVSVETGIANASLQLGKATIGAGLTRGKGFGSRSGALGLYDYTEVNLVFFSNKEFLPSPRDEERGKGFDYHCFWLPWPKDDNLGCAHLEDGGTFNFYQFELSATLGLGARVGFNFAEFADFLLGLIQVDFLEDDLSVIEKRREEYLRAKAEFQAGEVAPAK